MQLNSYDFVIIEHCLDYYYRKLCQNWDSIDDHEFRSFLAHRIPELCDFFESVSDSLEESN